jgi:hypothetical protein
MDFVNLPSVIAFTCGFACCWMMFRAMGNN